MAKRLALLGLAWGVSLWLCGIGPASAERVSLLVGDVDRDSRVSVGDVVQALRISLGLAKSNPEVDLIADISPLPGTNGRSLGDGRIDIRDVLAVLRLVAGLDTIERYAFTDILDPDASVGGTSVAEVGVGLAMWLNGLGDPPSGVTSLRSLKSKGSGQVAREVITVQVPAGYPIALSVVGGIHPNKQALEDYMNEVQPAVLVDGRPVLDLNRYRSGPVLVDLGPDLGAAWALQILLVLRLPPGSHEIHRVSHSEVWGDIDATYLLTVQ